MCIRDRNNDPHRLEVTEGIDKRLIARRRFKKDSQSVKLIVGNNDLNEAEKVADQILELTGYTDYVIEDSEAVSYTHLDVYKRQFLDILFMDIEMENRQNVCLLYTSQIDC